MPSYNSADFSADYTPKPDRSAALGLARSKAQKALAADLGCTHPTQTHPKTKTDLRDFLTDQALNLEPVRADFLISEFGLTPEQARVAEDAIQSHIHDELNRREAAASKAVKQALAGI